MAFVVEPMATPAPAEAEPVSADEPAAASATAEPAAVVDDRPAAFAGDAAAEESEKVVPQLPSADVIRMSQLDMPLDSAVPPAAEAPDIRTDPGETPSFVRRAEREARWRTPRARAALSAACMTAAATLAGQWALAQRDLIAARSPALKPLLAAACTMLRCEVRAPRALQALRVESSGLARVEKSDLYRLSVALRNLGQHEVAMPAFELALTDTQGQLIARRVLHAGELGARVDSLATGAELTLQSTIQVGSGPVAGYTIELFYP